MPKHVPFTNILLRDCLPYEEEEISNGVIREKKFQTDYLSIYFLVGGASRGRVVLRLVSGNRWIFLYEY